LTTLLIFTSMAEALTQLWHPEIYLNVAETADAMFFLKVLTVLRGRLAYPNGLLDLHIETFGRTP
jgi:hypothetical protein